MNIPLCTSSNLIPLENFWEIVYLYYERPHLINRNLAGITPLLHCEILENPNGKLEEIFTKHSILYEYRKNNSITLETVKKIAENVIVTETNLEKIKENSDSIFLTFRYLLKRTSPDKVLEFVILDKKHNRIRFQAIHEQNQKQLAPQFPYEIELHDNNLRIILESFEDADTASAEWLADKLFDKLMKWSENVGNNLQITQSLSLISIEKYLETYSNLKGKYSEELVKIWKEHTTVDAQKFVYEDLAIASYLICLWKNEDNIKFVDCGCGNGLLVHILNQENFYGKGIDVRKRKVWDLLSGNLQIDTINPASHFPEFNWIIGNHSDELTPWIPIYAAKSRAKFFLLPCCPYDFDGKKYKRINSGLSQYNDYFIYLKNICEKIGFNIQIDKLRIPSTKRTCIVACLANTPNAKFIKEISEEHSDYNARLPVEKVRNCTQIDKKIIDKIVHLVVNMLLSQKNVIENNGHKWNCGGQLHLSQLSQEIGKDNLQNLKKECGGLQTLLKNHRYIFMVSNGLISLRKPLKFIECTKYKSKPCWFYQNHPDKCLYDELTCCYNHLINA